MDTETFGAWLRNAMEARGYAVSGPRSGGISRLAEDAGVPQASVSRILNDRAEPSIDNLRKIGAALGYTLAEMLVFAGQATPDDMKASLRHPDPAAWARVADLLLRRRKDLTGRDDDTGRNILALDTGLDRELLADLERARRLEYPNALITAVELGCYRLAEGSIREALESGRAWTEFPRRMGGATHHLTLSTSVATGASAASAVDEPAEDISPPPDLPEHMWAEWDGYSISAKKIWWMTELSELKRAALVQVLKTMQDAEDRIAGASHPDAGDGRAHRAI